MATNRTNETRTRDPNRFRDFWDTLVCSLFWHDPADADDFGLFQGTICLRCGTELHRCKGSDQ